MIQGVADVSFGFLDISAGYPGSIHHVHVLCLSNLHREIEQGNWLNGPTKQISGSKIRPLLVGDSAYPLSVWLMKPFKQTRTLSERQLQFNRALSQAHCCYRTGLRNLERAVEVPLQGNGRKNK